jgi:hypothetical protein
MLAKLRPRLTFANVISAIALFVALATGGAYAANTIRSTDIVDGEVKTPDLADNAVTTPKIKPNSIGSGRVVDNSLQSVDVANRAITPAKIGTLPASRVVKTSGQSVPSNDTTFTPLSFAGESFDTMNLHDNALTNSRLRAPVGGIYQVSAGIRWAPNSSGDRTLAIGVNGACSSDSDCLAMSEGGPNPVPGRGTQQAVSDLVKLSPGDFVEGFAQQTSGGNLLAAAHPSTFLAITWVGPG